MLYQIYETQRALMAPFSEFASATAKLYSHPLSPFAHAPMAQRVSAGFDLLHRLAKEYEKPAFGITDCEVGGVNIAVQEQVALAKPFCRLLRFKRFSDNAEALARMKTQPTVLVVAPLSGHHSTLLRDTVKSLLQDHKVFITDWTDARMVPVADGPFHLSDYVGYVQQFIRHIGAENLHVISVCQPTVPVLAAVSLMASRGETTPRTMTMMGGPIDARRSPTAVNNLAMNKSYNWFETNVIFRVPPNFPGAGRAVYPGFLQHTGFVAMNPDRHLSSHWDYFRDLIRGDDDSAEAHRQFYDEYNAVLDMPAEYYLDTIKTVFQDFALVEGTWIVDGEPVRPQDIRGTALLTVEGELDDISGAGQTRAAHELCTGIPTSRQFHYDVVGAGHYGIFSGRRWREKVYPQVRGFIAAYDVPGLAADGRANGSTGSDSAHGNGHGTSNGHGGSDALQPRLAAAPVRATTKALPAKPSSAKLIAPKTAAGKTASAKTAPAQAPAEKAGAKATDAPAVKPARKATAGSKPGTKAGAKRAR